MTHIGDIIAAYRNKLGLSRKEFCKNICSEKFVYLIEKGQRSPSTAMVRDFSDILGVDLFEYYQYLECKNPIEIHETINNFNELRRTSNFEELKEATEKAKFLFDFNKEPWSFEIKVNKFSYLILVDQNYGKAITDINNTISRIKPNHLKNNSVANLYILLSTCYQAQNDLTNAQNAVSSAYEIVKNKQLSPQNIQIIITVYLNMMTMAFYNEDYSKMIDIGLETTQLQAKTDTCSRSHYLSFYLAFAYFGKGLKKEAVEWFKKGLYMAMIVYKPIDIYYISRFKFFDELINDESYNKELIGEFKKKYNIK